MVYWNAMGSADLNECLHCRMRLFVEREELYKSIITRLSVAWDDFDMGEHGGHMPILANEP